MRSAPVLLCALLLALLASDVSAQSVRVRDLTMMEGDAPVRLMGYGLVVGLQGTGDRVLGGFSGGGLTVRGIANLLRNMNLEVPEEQIRTRNVAAVIVTADVSPYTRAGGRFDIHVASIGDASSLRGGQLLVTPLSRGVGDVVVATAQGTVQLPPPSGDRYDGPTETSSYLVGAGSANIALGPGSTGAPSRLLLREPDLPTAQRIADAVNASIGGDVATVEDPGSIALQLPADNPLSNLVAIGDLEVTADVGNRVVIDSRTGSVAAGGAITVGSAVVSHDWLTLTIAPPDAAAAGTPPLNTNPPGTEATDGAGALPPGAVRAESGVQVQTLAEALHAVGATADVVGAVFQSLQRVGALQAEVLVR